MKASIIAHAWLTPEITACDYNGLDCFDPLACASQASLNAACCKVRLKRKEQTAGRRSNLHSGHLSIHLLVQAKLL
jgi:hypothetical protein